VKLDENGESTYLLAEQAWNLSQRVAAIEPLYVARETYQPLNIIDRQNGKLAMMIRRNEDLPSQFHYETSWVSFQSIVSPAFATNLPINFSAIGGNANSQSLTTHLTQLFQALFAGSGTGDVVPGSFQVAVSLSYPSSAAAGDSLPPIHLPIVLQLPENINFPEDTPGTPPYVTQLTSVIDKWLSENSISASDRPDLWAVAQLTFDIALFSDMSRDGQPILRLSNLFLPCKDIVS
jgi:hypothetical protein